MKKKKNNTKKVKNIKDIIKKNIILISLAFFSLILLIIGTITMGFISSFLIILFLDTIAIILTRPKKKKNNKQNGIEIIKDILIVCFILAILAILAGVTFLGYIIYKAPEVTDDKLYNKDATFLYTADGVEFAKLGKEIRQKITYDEISQTLIDAIIATEDSRYFQHSGVDLPRFLKASIGQVLGKNAGGASTITMQLSKLAFTSTKDEGIEGIIRKFSDIYISVFKIERNYTKEQILEFYLNRNYLGGNATGIEQASLNYFNKSASELNVAEAAMIAGLFQAPVAYDPYLHPDLCEQRRKTVLSLMLRHGYINEDEYEIAKELTVDKILVENNNNNSLDNKYQSFIDTVVEEVYERTGLDPYSVPMKIYTTLNTKHQDAMNSVMNGETYKWKDDKVQAGSVVVDVKDGSITAVGAGRNRPIRGLNYATDLKNQIGSTAKPLYDYGPAIEYYNWSTYTPIADEPYSYSNGTKFYNWDNKYLLFETAQEALKESRNIPAVKTFRSLDNSKIIEFVTKLGLSPEIKNNSIHEAHAIGGYNGESPLTLAAAYAAFSNGGYYIEPHSFTYIEFTETGDTYSVKPIKRKAMSSETAYMIAKMLEATSSSAIGSIKGINYAGKTGTTNLDSSTIKYFNLPSNAIYYKWVASFSDSYAITLWYGYDEIKNDQYVAQNDYSVKSAFLAIAKNIYTKRSNWTKPSGVIEAVVENQLPTAMLASENTPQDLKVTAYFKKGFEPTETSTRFSRLSNVTNLNYSESTNTLYWDNVQSSPYMDTNYLTNMYSDLFINAKELGLQVEAFMEYNNTKIGNIIYDIYVKNADGTLTYIDSTSSNHYIYPINDTTTFVVKTNYSILKTLESYGSEFTITKIKTIITADLTVDKELTINIGDTYIEPYKPVIVLEDGINDITYKATITKQIKNENDEIVDNIDTSKENNYKITYTINYNNFNYTLTRKIKVEKKTSDLN